VRTIAITSGKGGVGKTAIAINLGCALSEAGKRVVLFDADLQLANLDVALGIAPVYSLQHVVSGEKSLMEVLTSGPMGMRIVTGGSGITSLMHAGPQRLAKFMSQLDDLADTTDFLLFDTAVSADSGSISGLTLGKSGGLLQLDWVASCNSNDDDYAIYEGTLGGTFDDHASKLCSTGGATSESFSIPNGNVYFVVVPTNPLREGSYGRDGNDAERGPGSGACATQAIGVCQ